MHGVRRVLAATVFFDNQHGGKQEKERLGSETPSEDDPIYFAESNCDNWILSI